MPRNLKRSNRGRRVDDDEDDDEGEEEEDEEEANDGDDEDEMNEDDVDSEDAVERETDMFPVAEDGEESSGDEEEEARNSDDEEEEEEDDRDEEGDDNEEFEQSGDEDMDTTTEASVCDATLRTPGRAPTENTALTPEQTQLLEFHVAAHARTASEGFKKMLLSAAMLRASFNAKGVSQRTKTENAHLLEEVVHTAQGQLKRVYQSARIPVSLVPQLQ